LLDDAAVVSPVAGARSLVFTIDVVTPIVDDARVFGRIAAANSLSDVYAMGGRAEIALSFLGFPTDVLGTEMAAEVLAGVHEACAEAGCAILGGHTMKDTEPKCGLAVIGSVAPDAVWSQRFARPGDALVLTKPIGTGLVGQAVRKGDADAGAVAEAVAQMCQLNDRAADVGRRSGVHACTDVTGFGLVGHLLSMLQGSRAAAKLRFAAIPILASARRLVALGTVPGGTRANLRAAGKRLVLARALQQDESAALLLCDAQTSGGLLAAVAKSRADTILRELARAGVRAAAIGSITRGRPRIVVEA
jgi:selenide,water dikinase